MSDEENTREKDIFDTAYDPSMDCASGSDKENDDISESRPTTTTTSTATCTTTTPEDAQMRTHEAKVELLQENYLIFMDLRLFGTDKKELKV